MPSEAETDVVHVLPHPLGGWFVRVGNESGTPIAHPTVNVAERHAQRRATALGIDLILVHDRYQRVHQSRAAVHAR
jgi:hypothetical protein